MRNFSEIVAYSGYLADRIGGLTLAWSSNISIIFIRSARFVQPKLRPVRPGKVVHLKRWNCLFETFLIGPNRSIEFWTQISGNFG